MLADETFVVADCFVANDPLGSIRVLWICQEASEMNDRQHEHTSNREQSERSDDSIWAHDATRFHRDLVSVSKPQRLVPEARSIDRSLVVKLILAPDGHA